MAGVCREWGASGRVDTLAEGGILRLTSPKKIAHAGLEASWSGGNRPGELNARAFGISLLHEKNAQVWAFSAAKLDLPSHGKDESESG